VAHLAGQVRVAGGILDHRFFTALGEFVHELCQHGFIAIGRREGIAHGFTLARDSV
jgi:hypothetical protein